MDKLSDDIKKKIYEFSGTKEIPELCASNISKQMNKIQAFQIRKLTKQFIRNKNNIDIFFSVSPKCVEKYILINLKKNDLIKVVNKLYLYVLYDSEMEDSLLEFMYKLKVIGINSINNAIDSLQKKELCSLWKDLVKEIELYNKMG